MATAILATTQAEWERFSSAAVADQPVLVVHDDPDARAVIRYLLELEGMEVETAGNGYQALARALYRRPALVLLDLDIPFFSGEAIARELRATYGYQLPIILVSGNDDLAQTARRIGAAGYVTKPLSRAKVVGAVQRVLTRALVA